MNLPFSDPYLLPPFIDRIVFFECFLQDMMREVAVFSKYKVKIRSNPIFCQEKRPPRANPRRSENPLFMRFISDYSMIVATLPEPTVLPPSRYQTDVLRCANGDFSCDLWRKIWIFPLCPCGFGGFCYHGVITYPLISKFYTLFKYSFWDR